MEKEYYKNLAEKYFAGDITEAEISELAGWLRPARQDVRTDQGGSPQ